MRNKLFLNIFAASILTAFLTQSLLFAEAEIRAGTVLPDNTIRRGSPAAATPESYDSIQNQFERAKYEAFKIFSNTMEQYKEGKLDAAVLEGIARLYELSLQLANIQTQSQAIDFTMKNFAEMAPKMAVDPKIYSSLATPIVSQAADASTKLVSRIIAPEVAKEFPVNKQELERVGKFLKTNVTKSGMPLSYKAPRDYWKRVNSVMDDVDSVLERQLVAYSVSVYDAAVWQIALTVQEGAGKVGLVDQHTEMLLRGTIGDLREIRAVWPYMYGDRKVKLERDNAYFFRIIADQYVQPDPRDGKSVLIGFPNSEVLHHEDWKPITGEQAWAAIIGPLQVAYQRYHGNIPLNCSEMKLALSLVPAFEAMQNKTGGFYHAPAGTHGKNPNDMSNENNFSMYAALKMLYQAVKGKDKKMESRLLRMISGLERYFKEYAFNYAEEVFYQGGYYLNGTFVPTEVFAVDCQTWGTAVLGVDFIDKNFGEGAAYRIWQNTKRRAGFFDGQRVVGVGFTDGHRMLSVEWGAGAILNLRLMAQAYKKTHPDWAAELEQEAVFLRYGLESQKVNMPNGGLAYNYANERTFIPFGWWSNPIPSLVSSAWVILVDYRYNPFVLGGGPDFRRY